MIGRLDLNSKLRERREGKVIKGLRKSNAVDAQVLNVSRKIE